MRAFVVLVCIKLRLCGHLALSSCITLHAKHMLCLVVLKACVPKFCVLLYSAVLRGSLFVCVIVASCDCQLDFNKGLLLLLIYYYYSITQDYPTVGHNRPLSISLKIFHGGLSKQWQFQSY